MPTFKTLSLDFIEGARTASYGIPEMRELAKITGSDPYKGGRWSTCVTVENIAQIVLVLLKRDDPTLTIERVENEILSPDHNERWMDVFYRLDIGKTLDELIAQAKEQVEPSPLTVGAGTEPSVGSASASRSLKSIN